MSEEVPINEVSDKVHHFLRKPKEHGNQLTRVIARDLFSGEDMLKGQPFHHEDITETALKDAGFALETSDAIAWHADYVDSYLYNPIWWFSGVVSDNPVFDRFVAARSISPELEKLHFDDLGTSQVVSMFLRYMRGCLVGLYWAAEIYNGSYMENIDPIGAAHNIIGVTLHAIQDFFSHSNWIDEVNRRDKTFLDFQTCDLDEMQRYTGYYEDEFSSLKPHG